MAEVVQAVTGWEDVDIAEVQRLGDRRLNIMRAFNAREGLDRRHDTLPKRFFSRPLIGGPTDGRVVDKEQFTAGVDTYYWLRGWDMQTGNPTRPKLEELGLDWVADQARVS